MRVGRLTISGDLLLTWLKDGCTGSVPVQNHLPADVRLIQVMPAPIGYGGVTDICLDLESESFAEHVSGPVRPLPAPFYMPILTAARAADMHRPN